LLLDPQPASGFARIWKPQVFPPERHIGYAFTWFCFAAVAIAILIVTHRTTVEK
jgi:cytochrome oxidase assembly protein ShyY1